MSKYAQNTTVSVERSRAEIETILGRYGADAFSYATEAGRAMVSFRCNKKIVRFILTLPDKEEGDYPLDTVGAITHDQPNLKWEACPYTATSLLAMIKFSVVKLQDIVRATHRYLMMISQAQSGLRPGSEVYNAIPALVPTLGLDDLASLPGFPATKAAIQRLNRRLDAIGSGPPPPAFDELERLLTEIDNRFQDEAAMYHFFQIAPEDSWAFETQHPFGEKVFKSFPSARRDAKEAAECLALGKSAASVYHSLMVLWAGLKIFADNFKVATDHRAWTVIIKNIQGAVKKIDKSWGQDWKDKRQYFSSVIVHLQFLTDAWRNHAMHQSVEYDKSQAEQIMKHVQAFLEELSKRFVE